MPDCWKSHITAHIVRSYHFHCHSLLIRSMCIDPLAVTSIKYGPCREKPSSYYEAIALGAPLSSYKGVELSCHISLTLPILIHGKLHVIGQV